MVKRNFARQCLYHLCKISHDGSVVFYSISDYLVFTTVVFAYAAQRGIVITEFCIMRNHFHIAAYADSRDEIVLFYKDICGQFSRMYNRREGKIKLKWKRGSNISEKYSAKDKRFLYLYIADNALEKKACRVVTKYIWNFLAINPLKEISTNLVTSNELELAMAIVRDSHKNNRPLTYDFMEHFGSILQKEELNKLIYYIIQIYVDVNTDDICSLFGSWDNFIHESNTSRGYDYNIDDDFTSENYLHYTEMTKVAAQMGFAGNDSRIHSDGFDLFEPIRTLAFETGSSNVEISRFLHVPLSLVETYTCRKH